MLDEAYDVFEAVVCDSDVPLTFNAKLGATLYCALIGRFSAISLSLTTVCGMSDVSLLVICAFCAVTAGRFNRVLIC